MDQSQYSLAHRDIKCDSVHWQVALLQIIYSWSLFDGVSPAYWLSVWSHHSVGWSSELRFAVADSIQYSWILEYQVCSNLPILSSLPISTHFSVIHVFSPYSWYCGMRKLHCWALSEIEWHMWQVVPIICLQLKVSKLRVFPSCNF